jgi:transcriptional regulator with GAF, ATPase, and Fis domain
MKKTRGKRAESSRARRGSVKSAAPKKDTNRDTLKFNLEALTGICRVLGQSAGESHTFERILNLIGKAVEFSRASLFILNKRKQQMEEIASIGGKIDLIESIRFDAGPGLSAWVAGEKRPILLSNLQRKKGGDAVRSFLTVPCLLNGELFGVMNFGHIKAYAFDREDVEFLALASLPVTLCLERMHYYSEIRRLENELNQVKEENREFLNKVSQLQSAIPTNQFLENLNEKIKTPLTSIAGNAEFLLNSFSSHPTHRTPLQNQREIKAQFKRGLREIKSEVNQIAKMTEKLLRKSVFAIGPERE